MKASHDPPAHERPLPRIIPVLLAALLLSAVSVTIAVSFTRALPLGSMLRIGNTRVRSTLEAAARALVGESRDGLLLAQLGSLFSDGWKHPANALMREKQISDVAPHLSQVGVARLIQLAARLNSTEHALAALGSAPAGAPQAGWSVAKPYLEGWEKRQLSHEQLALRAAIARAYESLGLRPGTALALAGSYVGHALNPLLEYLTPQIERLAAEAEQAGDAKGAASARRAFARLLRQWTLEPGPAGLRLLAADLLAGHLERRSADHAGGDAAPAIVTGLRSWRAAYLAAAAARPTPVFQVAEDVARAVPEQSRLLGVYMLMLWLATGCGAAALLALATGWTLLRPRAPVRVSGLLLRGSGLGLFAAGLLCIGWLLALEPQVRLDMRMDPANVRYWPKFAIGAAASALLVITTLASLLKRRAPHLRLGGATALAAAYCWLAFSIFGGLGPIAYRQLAAYETALAAAHADPIASVAGPQADSFLDPLRAWEP